jgi:hypothetical protein
MISYSCLPPYPILHPLSLGCNGVAMIGSGFGTLTVAGLVCASWSCMSLALDRIRFYETISTDDAFAQTKAFILLA